MSIPIQLFESVSVNKISLPDIFHYSYDKFFTPEDNFIISRDSHGMILSYYSEDIWDLTPYASSLTQKYTVNFKKNLNIPKNIQEFKKLFFLLMALGSPTTSESYSVSTLVSLYKMLSHLASFAEEQNSLLSIVLSDNTALKRFISKHKNVKKRISDFISIILFLDKMNNNLTGIQFKRDDKLLNYLRREHNNLLKEYNQTEVIPSKIFVESIKQRWEQIGEIELYINNLVLFMKEVIRTKYFAASNREESLEYRNHKDYIKWEDAVKKYKLVKLYKKYGVTNKSNLKKFIRQIQGTSNHLIHAYTGMRRGEVLSLRINCINKIDDNQKVRLIGITTKFQSDKKTVEWITTPEIEKVINLLSKISKVLTTKIYFEKEENRYIFISTKNLSSVTNKNPKIVPSYFKEDDSLPLDIDKIEITEESLKELEDIDYTRDWRSDLKFKIGKPWYFKTHQYRRTLAVYSIQSGLVSLASLKVQFKHLFREMSYYYQNGAINAKNIFNIDDGHISNEINTIKKEIDALSYIKSVLLSEEEIYGIHGNIIKSKYNGNKDLVTKDIENIIINFKKEETSWSETPIGGCTQVEPCDMKLIRSTIECIACTMAVHKKSKLRNVIFHQEEFIKRFDINSIDYRTINYELEILKNYLNKLEGKE